MGWNSYTGYGWLVSDSIMQENLTVFIDRFAPYGYEYFVIDDGWQGYAFDVPDSLGNNTLMFDVSIDSFGRCVPDPGNFSNGLKPLIDRVHENGLRFGLWIICGAPVKAARMGLPIKGTYLSFREELDTTDFVEVVHGSCRFRKGLAGMQAYYNSVFELLAQCEVDFVKYDWINDSPEDIAAVASARDRCGRKIILSLSARGTINLVESYSPADMVRITTDVWDDRESLQKGFDAWYEWSFFSENGFWLDLDMIPFGTFIGFGRTDTMTYSQKKSFMTQRAMAASPLMLSGALTHIDSISYRLTTDLDMLACNRNGTTGKLVKKIHSTEIWQTPSAASADTGWIGVFNRSLEPIQINFQKTDLGLEAQEKYELFDIWEKTEIPDSAVSGTIDGDGVLFIRYRKIR